MTMEMLFSWDDNSLVSDIGHIDLMTTNPKLYFQPTFTRWAVMEPSKHPTNAKDCVYYEAETQTWVTEDCSTSMLSVCKRLQEVVETPEPPQGCHDVCGAIRRSEDQRLYIYSSTGSTCL